MVGISSGSSCTRPHTHPRVIMHLVQHVIWTLTKPDRLRCMKSEVRLDLIRAARSYHVRFQYVLGNPLIQTTVSTSTPKATKFYGLSAVTQHYSVLRITALGSTILVPTDQILLPHAHTRDIATTTLLSLPRTHPLPPTAVIEEMPSLDRLERMSSQGARHSLRFLPLLLSTFEGSSAFPFSFHPYAVE